MGHKLSAFRIGGHTPDQRAALSVLELTDHEVGGYRCLTRHLRFMKNGTPRKRDVRLPRQQLVGNVGRDAARFVAQLGDRLFVAGRTCTTPLAKFRLFPCRAVSQGAHNTGVTVPRKCERWR
jgi:hypothetical protein